MLKITIFLLLIISMQCSYGSDEANTSTTLHVQKEIPPTEELLKQLAEWNPLSKARPTNQIRINGISDEVYKTRIQSLKEEITAQEQNHKSLVASCSYSWNPFGKANPVDQMAATMSVLTTLKQELTTVEQHRFDAHQSKLQALQDQVEKLRQEEKKYKSLETINDHLKCPATCDTCKKRSAVVVKIGKLLKQIDELKK